MAWAYITIFSPRNQLERNTDNKSLASICKELLGISLLKELQCSDWLQRPLGEEQKAYAAADAQFLLDMLDVSKAKMEKEGCAHADDLWFENMI